MSKTFLNEYAVAFSTIGLFTNITAFMPGNKASEWTDAYAILRAGHWPLLDPSKITPTTMDDAAADGRLDIVAWLQEHHSEVGCTTNAMDLAAAGGHLDIVKFLHQYRTEGCTKNAMTQAAAGGYLDVVEYLFHSTTYKFDMTDAMRHATEFNHKDVVEWLERQHLRCPPLMVEYSFGDEVESAMTGIEFSFAERVLGFIAAAVLRPSALWSSLCETC